ncbi:MAG: hypothetical protein J6A47_06665 [Bacilli bacterium]|nr:hypothetical protein [Bacilli bacterium]
MNVPKCPLCGTELFGCLCPICGFDAHKALNLDPWPFDDPKDPSDPFADPLAPLLFCDPNDDPF